MLKVNTEQAGQDLNFWASETKLEGGTTCHREHSRWGSSGGERLLCNVWNEAWAWTDANTPARSSREGNQRLVQSAGEGGGSKEAENLK